MSEECLTVSLSGGGPWGFRLQGGAGTGRPLVVYKVRRRSKAYRRLREGDEIISVNGQACSGLTYDQVMEIADQSQAELTFTLRRSECNKENQAPEPTKRSEPLQKTQELTSSTETSSKTFNEREVLSIQSATLLPKDQDISKDFSSPKRVDKLAVRESQTFTPFQEIERPVVGSEKNSSVVEESRQMKSESSTEQKTVLGDMPDITLDTIDLNNLISATQRKLENFRPGGASPDQFVEGRSSPGYSKTTTTTTESQTRTEISKEMKTTVLVDPSKQKIEPYSIQNTQEVSLPIPPESNVLPEPKAPPESKSSPETRPLPKTLEEAYKECFHEMEALDSVVPASLPDVLPGFTSTETSCETTESPFGTTSIMKKKKMFSSSSFYEEPNAIYPTVEEQVEMAKKIASSLADDTNSKSKGANMFYKRVKRSSKWIHEGPEPSDESEPTTPEVEPPTPDPYQVLFKPSKSPSKLKLVLDPRHPLDAYSLKSSGMSISEHNVVSPEVCHGLVKDLHSPVGKGAALFAKRKKKSEEWVVDEEKVKNLLRESERRALMAHTFGRQDSLLLKKSPWDAAMESPYGLCDAAWVSPDQLADTVIRAADQKRASVERSLTSPTPQAFTPAAGLHDVYHAKPPKGWQGIPGASSPMTYASTSSPAVAPEVSYAPGGHQQQVPTRPAYQNFNAVPRLWKGTTAR